MNPRQTVFDAKRLIGRRFDDADVKKDMVHWPFKVVDQQGSPFIEVRFVSLLPGFGIELTALVWNRLNTSERPSSSPLLRSRLWFFPSLGRPPRPSSERPSRRPSLPFPPTSTTPSVSPPRFDHTFPLPLPSAKTKVLTFFPHSFCSLRKKKIKKKIGRRNYRRPRRSPNHQRAHCRRHRLRTRRSD